MSIADLLPFLDDILDPDLLAETITFTHQGSPAVALNAFFDKDYAPELGAAAYRISVTCKTADVATAQRGDTVVARGVTYYVKDAPIDLDDGLTMLELTRG